MKSFVVALQFLTTLPLPLRPVWDERALGRSMACFPLVGLLLGGVLAGSDLLLAGRLPRSLADLLLVALLALLSGALHLDGLADVCDGLGARVDRERFLEVMQDPRVGAVGVVGVLLALLLKWQLLLALPVAGKWQALVLFPALARWGQVLCTVGSRRARAEGLGALCVTGAGWPQLAIALASISVAAWWLAGTTGLLALAGVSLLVWVLRLWSHRRLGGVTGDLIGAGSELAELAGLLLLAAGGGR